MLPAVNVFFELGRTGESVGRDGIEAFRLTDMMRHTRLQSLEQVIACLQAINEAARHVRQDANASLYFLDRRGYCLIAVETQQSIFRIGKRSLLKTTCKPRRLWLLRACPGIGRLLPSLGSRAPFRPRRPIWAGSILRRSSRLSPTPAASIFRDSRRCPPERRELLCGLRPACRRIRKMMPSAAQTSGSMVSLAQMCAAAGRRLQSPLLAQWRESVSSRRALRRRRRYPAIPS